MKRRTALFVAVLLAACSDRSDPVGPDPTGADPGDAISATTESAAVLVGSLPSALIPVEDALDRILDVLPDYPVREDLRAALVELSQALEAEDRCVVRTSRRSAEHALRDLGRHQPEEYEPDLAVVELALESVEESGEGKC